MQAILPSLKTTIKQLLQLMTDRRPVEVLLIDPNTDDVRLFLEAVEDENIAKNIHTVHSGAEALDFLHRRNEYPDAPRPTLILLDVDLPKMDGHQLLEELNNDPELKRIPVIVLTESDETAAVATAYELHANAYVQKPVEPDEFVNSVRSLENFWLELVWLPPDDEEYNTT